MCVVPVSVGAASASGAVGALTSSGQTGTTPRCLGADATIVGTPSTETIRGTVGDDVIVGGGSDGGDNSQSGDSIHGLGGDDLICADVDFNLSEIRAGRGDDRVRASGYLWGGSGSDELIEPDPVIPCCSILLGGEGDDVLLSRATEINWLVPGPGDDTVMGFRRTDAAAFFWKATRGVVVDLARGTAQGQGHDTLTRINGVVGSSHADVVFGSDRGDEVEGLGGQDVLVGRGGPDHLDGGNGDDDLIGRGAGDGLAGGNGEDRAHGGPGNDFLTGDTGRDMLLGRTGNDILIEHGRAPNLILAGRNRDTCIGTYRVPPNIQRGCEIRRATLPAELIADNALHEGYRASWMWSYLASR